MAGLTFKSLLWLWGPTLLHRAFDVSSGAYSDITQPYSRVLGLYPCNSSVIPRQQKLGKSRACLVTCEDSQGINTANLVFSVPGANGEEERGTALWDTAFYFEHYELEGPEATMSLVDGSRTLRRDETPYKERNEAQNLSVV